jgi:hypothetical protein
MICSNKIFSDHVKNTLFEGLTMTFSETIENVKTPLDLNGFGVLVTMKLSESSAIAYQFSTGNDTIIVTDPSNGIVTLAERDDLNNVGRYVTSVYLIDPDDKLVPFFTTFWEIVPLPNYPNTVTYE